MARAKSTAAREPRKRRTAEEARTAILDAAERSLVAAGPAGIRLQDVAAEVGVSHPTVLHHFGSREALLEAVVERAQRSLHADLVGALRAAPEGEGQVAALLEGVAKALRDGGHGRALLWMVLSGHTRLLESLRMHEVAQVVHELRVERRRGHKGAPVYEDTLFTVALAGLALVAQSVLGGELLAQQDEESRRGLEKRFRVWLARLLIEHLDQSGPGAAGSCKEEKR